MTTDIWSLPGPARLASSIGDALRDGGSCAVVAPARVRREGHWVFGAADAADVGVDHVEIEAARPPAAVFADHCGATWMPGPGMVTELARHEVLAGRIIGLTLPPRTPEWAAFTAAFLTALPAIPEQDRPQLLVFCGPDDLSKFRSQRLPITERWWWGAVGRLDTTIAASQALGDRADPVMVACITEVCGYDLTFVDTLAQSWDGSLDGLLNIVKGAAEPEATVEESSSLSGTLAGVFPPPRLQSDWDRGVANAWERYEPFIAPTAVPERHRTEVLRNRVWRGQLRELMPLVDEERARLEAWARSGPITERNVSYPIEIGYLTKLVYDDPSLRRRSSHLRRRAAAWLRDTRNTLAHRDIVSPADISEGLSLLDADRRQHG